MAEMSDAVKAALQKAAARAERHALLDGAVTQMERLLNYPLGPEMLPWGSAMSQSYVCILDPILLYSVLQLFGQSCF